MKRNKRNVFLIMTMISTVVLLIASAFIIYGKVIIDDTYEIGVRIATAFVAFATFFSTSLFSYLIYLHNKTMSKANDDANRRAEMFRDLQFASDNYSIIEFMDRMLLYEESARYVDKFIRQQNFEFHMISQKTENSAIMINPDDYRYFSLKIPFRVVEGKVVASIHIGGLRFERHGVKYEFISPAENCDTRAYLLYNEHTKRYNVIVNLIVPKDSDFFDPETINVFSKIKINMLITSLLGVQVRGNSELYFTNPQQKEFDGSNTYNITSSNFTLDSLSMSQSFINKNQTENNL